MKTRHSATVASAVAIMLGAAGCGSGDSTKDVGDTTQGLKCQGINECKGMSECAGPEGSNDCQGMNECAGMGWVSVESEEDCTDVGGTIIS